MLCLPDIFHAYLTAYVFSISSLKSPQELVSPRTHFVEILILGIWFRDRAQVCICPGYNPGKDGLQMPLKQQKYLAIFPVLTMHKHCAYLHKEQGKKSHIALVFLQSCSLKFHSSEHTWLYSISLFPLGSMDPTEIIII